VNRAERRRLRAMGERVDHKPDADCDFVRRFPHSRYCNRRIYEGERRVRAHGQHVDGAASWARRVRGRRPNFSGVVQVPASLEGIVSKLLC
jgi:hypothetical protein